MPSIGGFFPPIISTSAPMLADSLWEVLANLSTLVAGWAIFRCDARLRAEPVLATLAWSTTFGASATILVFGITSILGINGPWVILAPALLGPLVLLARSGPTLVGAPLLRDLAALLGASTLATFAARLLRLGGYTGDSFQLIASARALGRNQRTPAALVDPYTFESFPPGYSLLQIPMTWSGNSANHGLGVLLAVAILSLVGQGLRRSRRPPSDIAVVGLIALMASTHFFWVMTTYINSHAVVALLLLAAYLRLNTAGGGRLDDLPLLVAVSALVVLRVENLLLIAALLTMPAAMGRDPTLGSRLRSVRGSLTAAGVTGLVHQAIVLNFYRSAEQSPSISTIGMIAAAVGLVVVALAAPQLVRGRILPSRWTVPVLVAANLTYAVVDTNGFARSVLATLNNLFAWRGGWGILPPLIVGLVLAAIALRDPTEPGEDFAALLSFLFAAALLLFFTSFLREAPFRIGAGDSLNRQLFHLLPLCLLAVGQAIGAGQARLRRPLIAKET